MRHGDQSPNHVLNGGAWHFLLFLGYDYLQLPYQAVYCYIVHKGLDFQVHINQNQT